MTPPINSVSPERLEQMIDALRGPVGAAVMQGNDLADLRLVLAELAARRAANTPVDGVDIAEALYDELLPLMQADALDVYGRKAKAQAVILSALASRTPNTETVVKALEWINGSGGDEIAHTVVGTYGLGKQVDGIVALRREGFSDKILYEGGDRQEAKAAAQADFDRRIRSALASPPSPAEVTDEQKPTGGFYRKCSADTPGAEWAEGVGYHVHDEQARIEGRAEVAAMAMAANFGRYPTLCEDCPPPDYPTDETRCLPCPRRAALTVSQEKE